MNEIAPAITPVQEIQNGPDYGSLLQEGLDRCGELGFDVAGSLQAAYGEGITGDVLVQRKDTVISTAGKIAEDMQLVPEFFNRPAHTIMLISIAESWASNEERSLQLGVDRSQIVEERESLVDIACMLAGINSVALQDIANSDPHSRNRYVEEAESPEENEAKDFIEAHVNIDLSDKLQAVLDEDGEGSFLEAQRAALNLSKDTEKPFKVKVMGMAESVDIYCANIRPKIEHPDYSWIYAEHSDDENRQHSLELKNARDMEDAQRAEEEKLTKPYDEYVARFAEKFGTLPAAFVRMNGKEGPELFLRAPQALAVLKYFKGEPMPPDEYDAKSIEDIFAIVRHEYAHTQKQLVFGPHHQLGLNVEERKAEFVSGDRQGYQDIKFLFNDLSLATGTKLTQDFLASALKEDDALSSFLAKTAQGVGMRNAMLLMALKPLPYEKNPEHAKQFVDLSNQLNDSDVSTLDIPLRETVARLGESNLRQGVKKWMKGVEEKNGELTDFHEESFPSYRQAHGIGVSTQIIREEVRKIRAARKAA